MSISIVKHNAPKFTQIEFACDKPIHPKLDKFELSRRYWNRSNFTVFCGTMGQGKTSLVINIIMAMMKKCYHHIYVFMPETSRHSLKNNIFKHLPEDQMYDQLDEDSIADVYERIQENSHNDENSLIIYDDCQKSLKTPSIMLSLKNMVANQRHLRTTHFMLLQNYMALDCRLRELVQNVVLFKLGKKQRDKVFEELIDTHHDRFDQIQKFVYDSPRNWLFINIASQCMFKGFDEIIFDDDGPEI